MPARFAAYTDEMPNNRRSRWTLTALLGIASKCLLSGCAGEPTTTATANDAWFDEVRWEHRLLVITGPGDSAATQNEVCRAARDGMLERELIVVDVSQRKTELIAGVREDLPDAASFRSRFDLPENEFQIVLVGKDGGVKERRNELFEVAEVFRIIDAMPMRMQEMQDRSGS